MPNMEHGGSCGDDCDRLLDKWHLTSKLIDNFKELAVWRNHQSSVAVNLGKHSFVIEFNERNPVIDEALPLTQDYFYPSKKTYGRLILSIYHSTKTVAYLIDTLLLMLQAPIADRFAIRRMKHPKIVGYATLESIVSKIHHPESIKAWRIQYAKRTIKLLVGYAIFRQDASKHRTFYWLII